MEDKGQIALPEKRLPQEMFPAQKDGGDRKTISPVAILALITWAEGYGLDAWQGHVIYMFSRPYVTERGAVANAQTYPEYNGYTVMSLDPDAREARGLARDGYAYQCDVRVKDHEFPITDFGEVAQEEIDKAREHFGEGAAFLPVVNHPRKMALARAIRRAHLLAFPLRRKGEGEAK